MAAAVLSSAGESLATPSQSPDKDSPPSLPSCTPRPSPSTGRSPRCEAFVMTGDKILNLNPNISPSYAKVARDQLPPRMSVHDSPVPPSTPLSSMHFPSTRRGRLQSSMSQPEGVTLKMESGSRKRGASSTVQEENEERREERREGEEGTGSEGEGVGREGREEDEKKERARVTRDTRTTSSETFVLAPESPSKMSSVTIEGIASCQNPLPSSLSFLTPEDPSSSPLSPLPSTTTPTRSSSISRWTAHAVLSHWAAMRIDAAMREFLAQVELKGETSQRERILMHFSRRYFYANPTSFNSFDEVHALGCGLLLLNSDLHTSENSKKMTCREFVNNMGHTGYDYPKPLLKALYSSIKESPLSYAGVTEGEEKKTKGRRSVHSVSIEADPRNQIEYKRGFLMRKVVYDSDGTATPLGRRGWRMHYVRLRALALYFSRDDGEQSLYNALSAAVLIHHSIAEPATDYTKRKNVFRLRTAGLGEILFQTSNEPEMLSWVQHINNVAACFSSRALPPAVDSRGELCWPRLPRVPSTASLEDQMAAHESAATALRDELQRWQRNAPPVRTRGKAVEKFFFSERLLMQELSRYETYCSILRARLERNSSDSGILSKASNAAVDIDEADRLSYREAILLAS